VVLHQANVLVREYEAQRQGALDRAGRDRRPEAAAGADARCTRGAAHLGAHLQRRRGGQHEVSLDLGDRNHLALVARVKLERARHYQGRAQRSALAADRGWIDQQVPDPVVADRDARASVHCLAFPQPPACIAAAAAGAMAKPAASKPWMIAGSVFAGSATAQ